MCGAHAHNRATAATWRHDSFKTSPDTLRPRAPDQAMRALLSPPQAACGPGRRTNLWPSHTNNQAAILALRSVLFLFFFYSHLFILFFLELFLIIGIHQSYLSKPASSAAARPRTWRWLSRMICRRPRRRGTGKMWRISCRPELKLTASTVLDEPLCRSVSKTNKKIKSTHFKMFH